MQSFTSTTLNLRVESTDIEINSAFHLKLTWTAVKQRECCSLERTDQETHRRKPQNAIKKDISISE